MQAEVLQHLRLEVYWPARAPACTCARCRAAGLPASLSSAAMTALLMGACLEALSTLCRSCRTTSFPSLVSCIAMPRALAFHIMPACVIAPITPEGTLSKNV